jgi:pilus assembly protein Flp/PilA
MWPFAHETSLVNAREVSKQPNRTPNANESSGKQPKPKRSKHMIKKFFRDETGLELSEYAVAAALVAIAVVGAFTALGGAISGKITTLGTTISK